jgi:tyrosine decarboxylase / aspartate 1-decarboxylase
LERGREAALRFFRAIESGGKFDAALEPELDILVFVPKGNSLAEISARSRRIFEESARFGLYLAVAELPVKFWPGLAAEGERTTVTCLRSVLMKPEHLEWSDQIVGLLEEASGACG